MPLAFAHRGGAAAGLENSMIAFERAVRLGYRYLETDVRATVDGVVLAFHDATLDRATDRTGVIRSLPYTEVAGARIAGVAPIPTLADLLDSWPDVRVNVDVKAASAIPPLLEVIRRAGAIDRVCVAAFSESRIARVRAAGGPRLCTALGPRGVLSLRLSSYAGRSGRPAAPCAQVPVGARRIPLVDDRFVAAAHRAQVQVHVWTIDTTTEIHRLLDLGVDGIMTDELETLREALISRGAWHP